MGQLAIMDRTGDTKHIWSPDNPDEVAAAKALFDDLVTKKKAAAFAVDEKGEKSERLKAFDPKAGKIIIVPQLMGG